MSAPSELGALLVGERHNARRPGFDFGNAPAELAVADLTVRGTAPRPRAR